MKPVFIEGTTLNDTWHQLLWNLNEYGRRYKITSGSYAGAERVAFDFASGCVHLPHVRPLAVQMPEGSTLPTPCTEDQINQYFANYLMDSRLEPNEDYRYGTWIVGGKYQLSHFIESASKFHDPLDFVKVPNQVQWVIDHFKIAGLGNEHCYLTVGYPESNLAYDIEYYNEQERKTSPCLRGLDFRVVDGALTTHVVYRSWDLFSGWPVNMGGFALLNEYVAQAICVNPGPLTFSCKSLHCYDFQIPVVKARLGV